MAFDGGVSLGEMASDNVDGEAGPSREEVALDCVEEGARARAKGGCVKPLNQLLLCLWCEEGVGVVFGAVLLEREGPKAVGESRSGEYWLIVTVDGDGMFAEGCRAVVVT